MLQRKLFTVTFRVLGSCAPTPRNCFSRPAGTVLGLWQLLPSQPYARVCRDGVSILQRVTKCWVSGVQSGQVQPQPPPHKSKTILSILWCKVRARIERLNCSIEERERTNFLILTSGMLTSATGCLFFLPVPRASGSSYVLVLSFSYLNLKTIAHH